MAKMSSSKMFDAITIILTERGNGMFHLICRRVEEDQLQFGASLKYPSQNEDMVIAEGYGSTPAEAVQVMLEDHEARRSGQG